MGMDVHGIKPKSERGKYFRRNAWGWRPLATMCCEMFPDITSGCKYWQSNDGDGLDADASVRLADALDDAVASGRVATYVRERDASLAALPRVRCKFCNGTGIRNDEVGRIVGMTTKTIDDPRHPRFGEVGTCNACKGHGDEKDTRTWYTMAADDATEFAAFLRDCGGFEIS